MTMEPRREPQQQRSAYMVALILSATEDVLLRQGARRMTAERIAERAGVGIGSFYRYFPNKKAVVGALIGKAQARRRMAIEGAIRESADLDMTAAVKLLSAAAVRDYEYRQRLREALTGDEMAPLIAGVIAAENNRIRSTLREFILRYRGDLKPIDAAAAAGDIVVMARAIFEAPDRIAPRSSVSLQQALERMIGGYLTWQP